jgi:pSer/pThr/pTyr-binding forkhead associated (FHA) protein
MELVTDYLRKARGMSQSAFQQLFPHYFLFKHAKLVNEPRASDPDFEYATRTIGLDYDPMPGETELVAVKKNPENPFPDRLTIGRAPNCDVIIRLPFVSKVHAHLFIQADKLTLRDNKAANFTFHNHRKLEPGSSRSVKLGDVISLGALDLELIDSARLYALMRGTPSLPMGPPVNVRD